MHQDKKQNTYNKAEGDGFQVGALADEGYCYQFFMQNNPSPKKYSRYLPLHTRVMALFKTG